MHACGLVLLLAFFFFSLYKGCRGWRGYELASLVRLFGTRHCLLLLFLRRWGRRSGPLFSFLPAAEVQAFVDGRVEKNFCRFISFQLAAAFFDPPVFLPFLPLLKAAVVAVRCMNSGFFSRLPSLFLLRKSGTRLFFSSDKILLPRVVGWRCPDGR